MGKEETIVHRSAQITIPYILQIVVELVTAQITILYTQEEETCTGHCLATNQSIAAVLSADFSNATCDTWTQLSNLSVVCLCS